VTRDAEAVALFGDDARAWSPLLVDRYGERVAASVLEEAR
jgi:hypothetical protein